MRFSELWRLSGILYKEVSFQSIFALRSGSSLPRGGRGDVRRLIVNARTNTLISKLLTTVFVAIFGFTVFLAPTTNLAGSASSKELTMVIGTSAFLATVFFLVVFMGLQVSTSFVSSKIAEILGPLPLSKSDISKIVFLCFVKIFDIPLVASAVVFVAAYLLAGGTALGSVVAFAAVVVTETFALTATVSLAGFFYSRVSHGHGRSKYHSLLRLAFMLVWVLPTFAAYFVVQFAGEIVGFFASLTSGFALFSQVLVLIYPFSFGFLISSATQTASLNVELLTLSAVSSSAYLVASYFCLRWVTRTIGRIGARGTVAVLRETVEDTWIKPQMPLLGMIRKDLRIASRAPSYASLFLLPAIQTVILAMSFSSFSDVTLNVALGILTGVSLTTLLIPPTLLSIEGLASAYLKSLPTDKRTLIEAKTMLSTVIYALSMLVLLLALMVLGRDPSLMLLLGGMQTFSMVAAIMLETTILVRKFWKEDFALGNIYARLSTYILVLIPGFIVALVPIGAAIATYLFAESMVAIVFGCVALLEFAVMAAVVTRQK